jgi:hypothetical protein
MFTLRGWLNAIPIWLALPICIAGCVTLVLLQQWGLVLVLAILTAAWVLA